MIAIDDEGKRSADYSLVMLLYCFKHFIDCNLM